jgi:hypothetical protein
MSVGYPTFYLFQLLFLTKMNPKIWCGISILVWKGSMKTGRTGNELMLPTSRRIGLFLLNCLVNRKTYRKKYLLWTTNCVPLTCATSAGNFHSCTVQHLDTIKVFYLPTDAQQICFKRILKFTLKQLLHVSVQSPSSGSVLFELAKVIFI